MTYQKRHISLKKIEEEYSKDSLKDTEEMYHLKEVIDTLDDTDKALLILYADEGSMAKAGKKFSVSAATVYANIKRIRQIINERL